MRRETELLFEYVLKNNLPHNSSAAELQFFESKLARHYGLSGLEGNEFRKLSLFRKPTRSGLLGHGSFDGLRQWRGYLARGARNLRHEQAP